jgi:hypothetical protein
VTRYTKDEYMKRYYELIELTGCRDKASLMLSIEHNCWDINKLVETVEDVLNKKHLYLVPDERGR